MGYGKKEGTPEQNESSPKGRIINAIGAGNVDELVAALSETNRILTNKEAGHFSRNSIIALREMARVFFESVTKVGYAGMNVYLGDDGLSRISLGVDNGEITVELTDNSTNKVKRKWEELK